MPPKELPKGQPAPEKPVKKRSRFKVIMLGVGLLLLLAGGGGAGYWWLYLRPDATGLAGLLSAFDSGGEESPAAGAGEAPASGADSAASGNAANATRKGQNATARVASAPRSEQQPEPLPEFTVNLADAPGNRYLKIGMEVEFNTPEAGKTIQNETARVRDAIILLLSGKTVRELSAPDGKVMLKNEVASRLNQILGSAQVVRVYFTDFVIQ